jgi:phospholipase/carboxylesterase
MNRDPHRDSPVRHVGASLKDAVGAVVLLHGRGGSADDILSLAEEFYFPGLAYLAPEASGNSWYPRSFLAPIEKNEPWLTSALRKVQTTIQSVHDAGIPNERVVVAGFSQGACLATEYVARHPERYAALIAFTGGLIGPPGSDLSHAGDLAKTPAFFGSGDPDPHVPWERVQESADVLTQMGAVVITRRYAGRPHTVTREEIGIAKQLIEDALIDNARRSHKTSP